MYNIFTDDPHKYLPDDVNKAKKTTTKNNGNEMLAIKPSQPSVFAG